jgi:UDP-glucuronate 4-epimerase
MKILITGVAGFIGFHLAEKLLKLKYEVYGIDNLNNYYDIQLKKNRLKKFKENKNFKFYFSSLSEKSKLNNIVKKNKIKYIVNLAAQAGVRYSIDNPEQYFKSNIEGFFNILEISKNNKIKHLIYASTSSVYGDNKKFPLEEKSQTDKPLSFYAASKKTNEVMAYSYSHIYKIPTTGLRFFTVYGPFGRPDMALFKFTKSILSNKYLSLFNNGNHIRDFTYIDDITDGIMLLIKKPSKKSVPYNIFNIGSNSPKPLKAFIKKIEFFLKQKSKTRNLPLQLGDIKKTHASIDALSKYIKYKPKYNINIGIKHFIDWYKSYYKS